MKRKIVLVLTALGMLLATAAPAFAANGGGGGGATTEEFVCFFSAGDNIRLGEGKAVTTPSGNVNVVCTAAPID